MKFRMILIFTLVSIALISCRNKEITTEPKVIDLSSFGSVNMIKEIGGEIFVLNSTASSIHKLYGDSLSLFRDLEIGGRDFLLDFDIEGDKVYYSNTYDEIFISSGNTVEDTIKVLNPDRIAVMGSLLYLTSRKAENGDFYLKLIDLDTKELLNRVKLNDTIQTEMKFAQASICESGNDMWVMNPFRNRLEKYNRELQIVSKSDMPKGYEYGNIGISEAGIKIFASKANEVFLFFIKNDQPEIIRERSINSATTDIRTSCIAKDKVLLYDFINSSIIINLTK
jgi:hypothetical protein